MAGLDKVSELQETRKRCRTNQTKVRHQHSVREIREMLDSIPSTSLTDDCNSRSSSSDADEDYQSASATCHSSSTKKTTTIITKEVASSLDRVNLSDRSAMFVIGAVSQALGHTLDELSVSRSTIRRARRNIREAITVADKDSFSHHGPLILHWDGKLLS